MGDIVFVVTISYILYIVNIIITSNDKSNLYTVDIATLKFDKYLNSGAR